MEYFRIVEVNIQEEELKEKLILQKLEDYCLSIFPLDEGIEVCKIGGMWGDFTLRRDEIMGGVRFSMLDCPNALAWTVTSGYPPARDKVVVHLTINRQRKQQEFVEEIEAFLDDHVEGLTQFFSRD
jgi:hypothetical protein